VGTRGSLGTLNKKKSCNRPFVPVQNQTNSYRFACTISGNILRVGYQTDFTGSALVTDNRSFIFISLLIKFNTNF
jgi:hypothetical protein